MVEFVAPEIETANQRANGAIDRIHRDQRGLDLGQLRHLPTALAVLGDPNHRARLEFALCLVLQAFLNKSQRFAAQIEKAFILGEYLDLLGIGRQHQRRDQAAGLVVILQQVVQRFFAGFRRQHQLGLGPTPTVAPVVIQHALAHGFAGRLLIKLAQGGVDFKAAGIGGVLIALDHELPRHFGHVFARRFGNAYVVAHVQLLLQRCLVFRIRYVFQVMHAAQHIMLALAGLRRVGHRVVARGRLGQAGHHGHFGHG